MDVSE